MNQDPLKENRDLLEDFLLQGFPNPERKDCPHETKIKALAEERLLWSDPAGLHVGSCSECYDEYTQYRKDWEKRRAASLESSDSIPVQAVATPLQRTPKSWHTKRLLIALIPAASAACLLVGIMLRMAPFSGYRPAVAQQSAQRPVESAEVTREIHLFRYATTRGGGDDAVELEALSLPMAIVHLKIGLPLPSPPGHYKVVISEDRVGGKTVARGEGTATGSDPSRMLLSLTLDLRNASPGSYILSTESEQDHRVHHYLLELQGVP